MRLDTFLRKKYPHITRRELLRFFQEKKIFIGNRPALKGNSVTGEEDLKLPPEFFQTNRLLQPNRSLNVRVVFEDDAVIVVSKSAGMPSVPHSYDETDTMANFLIAHDPKMTGIGDKPLEPGMVHRLDTNTSGLMVAAKTNEYFKNLKEQFKERRVLKEYLALVEGVVEKAGEIKNPIGADPKNLRKVKVYNVGANLVFAHPQEAITQYRVQQSFPHHTLLRIRIITGVRHQIRAHLAFIGHPVVGDELYGSKTAGPRLCLHAVQLGFFHPSTDQWVEFEDPVIFPFPPP